MLPVLFRAPVGRLSLVVVSLAALALPVSSAPSASPIAPRFTAAPRPIVAVMAPRPTATPRAPAATTNATRPHAAGPAIGRPDLRLHVALPPPNGAGRRLDYRVFGLFLQRSLDAGRHWASIFGPNDHPRNFARGCFIERYQTVMAVGASALLPGTLLVATSGRPATSGALGRSGTPRAPRLGAHNSSSHGQRGGQRLAAPVCDAATGGLFALRPNGHGGLSNTDSLAAGLPYAQDPRGHTPRAYTLLDLTPDATNPDLFYADAALPPGSRPGSGTPPLGLYRTLDGGRSWQPALRGLLTITPTARASGSGRTQTMAPRNALTLNPAHGAFLYDVQGTRLYRSTIHGGQWWPAPTVRARRSVRVFVNPYNPHLVYALTDLNLYHSYDDGATWRPMRNSGLPLPRHILSLGFDPRAPSVVLVRRASASVLRLNEPRAPAPPHFDLTLTLTPQLYDRVVLTLHGAPLQPVRLSVVSGARPVAARLYTDAAGFAYATVRLQGAVVPAALRVRVDLHGSRQTVRPWLQPGWTPGQAPAPPPTPTPLPTATPTATATLTPTATATPTLTPTATLTPTLPPTLPPTATPLPSSTTVPIPTPYPPSPLNAVWTWKQLTPALPLCPAATLAATATITTAANPPTAAPGGPVATFTPVIVGLPGAAGATATPPGTNTPTSTPMATATNTPAPTATPLPSCSAPPPSARQDYAAAWDNADHRLYVFGGTDAHTSVFYNDISAFSTITGSWIAISPTTPPPPPRSGVSAVWDPAMNALLVFGGMRGAGAYATFTNDLWAYSPATNAWTDLSPNTDPSAPPARAHAAVAWDGANNRLLVFGGQTDDGTPTTLTRDLWSFTPGAPGVAGSWSGLSPNISDQTLPPARQESQIAWDPASGVLRLFGGKNPGSGALSDTWTWSSGAGWTFENVPDQPQGRAAGGYSWDATHGRFLVGPGLSMQGDSNDVWYDAPENSPRDWLQVPIANPTAPPTRQMSSLLWDAADNQALMFGGREQGAVANDLWALVPTGLAAPAPAAAPTAAPVGKDVDIGKTVADESNDVYLTPVDVQEMADAGVRNVRLSFSIGAGQTVWTPGRLHAYEQVITMLQQKNVGVIAQVGPAITGGWTFQDWLRNAQETTGGQGDNPAIQGYAQQLRILIEHFSVTPYNVTRWEVWNEPNVSPSLCSPDAGASCMQEPSLYPSNFADLLGQSYLAIKTDAAIPAVQLISGGIFGHSIGGSYGPGAAGADFIAATYDQGINHSQLWTQIKARLGTYPLDAVGVHFYVDQSQRTTPAVIRAYLDWFHGAYASLDPGKPIVVTELGWRTGTQPGQPQVTEDIQAANLDTVFEAARRAGYVQDIVWFALQDGPNSLIEDNFWGLYRRDGTAKPSRGEFQKQ